MTIKRGSVVSHTGATAWGVGMVMEIADCKATIQFSDGVIRKIAASHYATLQPADPAAFVATPESVQIEKKVRATPKRQKKLKAPTA